MPPTGAAKKTDAQVKAEIAAIIKQITASCTFLPMIEKECEYFRQPSQVCFPLCPPDLLNHRPALLAAHGIHYSGAFQILAYTTRLDEPVPLEWQDSDARLIAEGQAEQVKLRSFSTAIHKVDAVVAYRRGEDED